MLTDDLPVTIYGHLRNESEYVYVGATTHLPGRWPKSVSPVQVVSLEETTLRDQVSRETFWIEKLRAEGHPLTNSRKPTKIRVPESSFRLPHSSEPSPSRRRFSYDYPRPSVTVDVVYFGVDFSGLKILLVERKGSPFKGEWALPGGFVQMNEDLDTAASRELLEETGASITHLEQLYTYGNPSRDPRGRVISVAYIALTRPSDHEIRASSDANKACWFPVEELPSLAFDHRDIVNMALRRLLAKVRYAPIGFDLLPPSFTLRELQSLYEKLLGRTLDKRNFRKKILQTGLLQVTGETADTVPKSTLYRFNKDEYERQTRLGINFEI